MAEDRPAPETSEDYTDYLFGPETAPAGSSDGKTGAPASTANDGDVPGPSVRSTAADSHETFVDRPAENSTIDQGWQDLRSSGPDRGLELMNGPRPSDVLFGKYRVEKLLGRGGMGEVWLVRHQILRDQFALKLIVPGAEVDEETVQRFVLEAQVMRALSRHPHAVVVHDADIDVDRKLIYIVMDVVDGGSIEKRLRPGVPMPLGWTTEVLGQLCDVLHHAHERGIVHRDLSPANLMLEGPEDGPVHLRVLDFGIAKVLDPQSGVFDAVPGTEHGRFYGKRPYASPEQLRGEAVDPRSDLYSIGVILYEFLTGYRPFQGDRAKLTRDHCSTKPPWFAEVNPRVDLPAVERVVRRCLEKDPADRPRSAPELFELFRAAALKTGYSPPPGPHEHERENERLTSADVPRRPPSRLMARLATISFATFVCVVLTLVAPRPSRVRPPGPPPVDPKVIEIVPTTSAVAPARAVPAPMPPGLIEFLNDHELRPVAGAGIAPGGYPKIVEAGAERRRLVWHPGAYLPADHEPGPDQAKLGMLPTVLVRKDGTRFLLIEGGEFVMGAFDDRISDFYAEEKPGHHVALTSFYIQSTEVTFGEFERFRKETARDRNDPDLREGYAYAWSALATKMNEEEVRTHPAVGVTRKLAEAYARHVGGELPSEAQWEFAARSGGKNQLHVWGDQPQFPDHVNINNPIVVGIETRPVGLSTRDRTAQGVLDLTGNVREWCRDVWKAYPQVEPARDPVERAASDDINPLFVIRGGSYDTDRETARVTWRSDLPGKAYRMKENDYDLDLGFRVVLDVVALPAHLVAQPAAATGPAPAGEGGR